MAEQIMVDLHDPRGCRLLMDKYGDSTDMFFGTNDSGEKVQISITHDSITVTTLQHNGWVRKQTRNKDMDIELTYEGRWK